MEEEGGKRKGGGLNFPELFRKIFSWDLVLFLKLKFFTRMTTGIIVRHIKTNHIILAKFIQLRAELTCL